MKKNILLAVVAFLIAISSIAQDCTGYYYMNNGEVTFNLYDQKNKDNGTVVYKISNVKKGATTTATFTSAITDEKGKNLGSGAGTCKCTGGKILVDARVAVPQDQMNAYKDMQVKSDESYIEYPNNVSEGQSLADVDFNATIYNKDAVFAGIALQQTNRKVEAKESITVPAGTYTAYRITYDARFKASIGGPGGIGIPFNMKNVEWFVPGLGIVKSENRNKNGKSMGGMVLASIKKN